MKMKVWPGTPYPLGATWDGGGVNFALFAENASGVELCLFDASVRLQEVARIPMREQTDQVWHVYLPEARPGWLYGYRVSGPYEPAAGHRFNPAKLLLDPHAKAIAGTIQWSDALFGYTIGHPEADLSRDERDSAAGMPKCAVIDPSFSWGDDTPPRIPWHRTVIYELHVKGFTARHPEVAPELRGTYAGLACPAILEHLHTLGITAVELMPVHQFVADNHLVDAGLTNYWGYNTIGFLAPDVQDGHNDNLSWNCGIEGPTDDPAILALRLRQQRNFLATLFLSQGVPMLLAGDEMGRSQQGNNNSYCQDNELSWVDWQLDIGQRELLAFTRMMIRLFHRHPVLRRRRFFQGRTMRGSEVADLTWFRPDGKEMVEADWDNAETRCFGLRLAGDAIAEVDSRGNRIVDDTLLILLNAYHEPLRFILPSHPSEVRWQVLLDTREALGLWRYRPIQSGQPYELGARSLALLRLGTDD